MEIPDPSYTHPNPSIASYSESWNYSWKINQQVGGIFITHQLKLTPYLIDHSLIVGRIGITPQIQTIQRGLVGCWITNQQKNIASLPVSTQLKTMQKSNWIISQGRGANKQYLKPRPSRKMRCFFGMVLFLMGYVNFQWSRRLNQWNLGPGEKHKGKPVKMSWRLKTGSLLKRRTDWISPLPLLPLRHWTQMLYLIMRFEQISMNSSQARVSRQAGNQDMKGILPSFQHNVMVMSCTTAGITWPNCSGCLAVSWCKWCKWSYPKEWYQRRPSGVYPHLLPSGKLT